jgi:ATP-dependent protease ClpP protease subunit
MSEQKEDWHYHITTNDLEVWYTGDICLIGIHELIATINSIVREKELLKNKTGRVCLFIQSNGGCVNSALLLYDFINFNNRLISVIGLTKIHSAATILLFTKCDTFVFPHINVLFHPMTFDFSDNHVGVDKTHTHHKKLIKRVNDIYATKGLKLSWNTNNIYMYAEDLVKKRIADVWENY